MAKKKIKTETTEEVVETEVVEKTKAPKKKAGTKKANAKEKLTAGDIESQLSAFLEKETGVKLQGIADVDAVSKYIDTGNYSLNYAITGDLTKGLPSGRIYTLEGESGRGKSLQSCRIALENARTGGISIIIDIENALTLDFLTKIANNDIELAKKVKIIQGIYTIEDLQNWLNNLIAFQKNKGAEKEILVVVDSWSILSSKHELAVVEENKGKKDMSKAVAARMLLRSLAGQFKECKITPILVLHLTANIGVMFGDKTVPASHGNAALFMSSTRTQLYATQELLDANKNPVGTVLNFKTKKNRFTYKNKTAKVAFYFSGPKTGIDRFSGLAETLVSWGIMECSVKKTEKKAFEITPTATLTFDGESFKRKEFEDFILNYEGGEKAFITEVNQRLDKSIKGVETSDDPSNFEDSDDASDDYSDYDFDVPN